MFNWLIENWASLLVGGILLLVVVLLIKKVISDKKSGKGCGCGCEKCALSSQCCGKSGDKKEKTQ